MMFQGKFYIKANLKKIHSIEQGCMFISACAPHFLFNND